MCTPGIHVHTRCGLLTRKDCARPLLPPRVAEFWERYVRWLEGKGMEAEARGALQREVETSCKTRPEAHLFAARFEERHGRVQVCASADAAAAGWV